MTLDDKLLAELSESTLHETSFEGLGTRLVGKVRDSYVQDGRRTIVVSDRVSCFDVVVGTIPLKGQILNQLAAFWFEKTRSAAPNHLLEVPDPAVSVVQECELLPVEFVFRGYLTGSTNTSIWSAYEKGERRYCGHDLPDGLRRHEQLSEVLLTPTTKAPQGEHDELTSREELIEGGAISEELYDEAARITGNLFRIGQDFARSRGLILVDTKYELGLGPDGKIVVIDEIHTPDSSRYWYADRYEQAMSAGESPPALDKEYVRLWLGEQGYKGDGAPPALSTEVRCEAARRYVQTFEQLTGQPFEPNTEPPEERIRKNLGLTA
ncbi:MAG: phosphoribosylaminoimidazolesuccinocarboxamide synthase [Myxococcota bacterium]|nr:phosphoribosylaminoimidazolesuccinocarboxamide synthase [Myxococcota bacterium]